MLKCYVKEDPSAVFPKKRSVLLLAAVVLLLCCCLFVPAAAAEDVTVKPVVFGEYYRALSLYATDEWSVELVRHLDGGEKYTYELGVNVTVPPGRSPVDITFGWTDNTYDDWYSVWKVKDKEEETNSINGDTITSTIKIETYDGEERLPGSGYYSVKISDGDSEIGEIKFYVKMEKVLFKPMDLTIYANETFPKSRYEDYSFLVGSSSVRGFKVADTFYRGDDVNNYPFTMYYYNRTTNEQVSTPKQLGIYNAVIEPKEGIQISDITYKRSDRYFPVMFQNGTLTVLPTTENVMLSPSTSPDTGSNGNIFAYFGSPGYNLNGESTDKFDDKYDDSVYFLQDDLLDEEAALITDYIRANHPGYDAEMKYFDLVVDNIWVTVMNNPGIYWPYPDGTDRSTEFILLYFPDTRRSLEGISTVNQVNIVEPCPECEASSYHDVYDGGVHFCYTYKMDKSTINCAGLYALIWKDAADPVVIEPVNQTIYANEHFPSPLYSGIPENAVIEVNDAEWEDDTYPYPFEIAYYNTTTNTPISKPDTPGIYNATIQPAVPGVQLEQITIGGNPVTFRNGTLTVRQITDASETILVAQQTRGGDGISVSVPEDTIYYLNDNPSFPVTDGNIHLLHDEILAGGEETLKRIAPGYFDDSSKYEMKYFDLIDTGNGHTWVSSLKDVTITWPYPEGTDENTEFTLLHYLDLHREYFTDADLNSDTETVTVSKTGSGVQFSIQQSGFSPFALIWSDQKPVPTPPSGGGSSDGNMDNAFRVLFNDGTTTLFVVTDLSYGDKLTKPEDPVKDGYTFAGWHKDAACTQAWDFADGITGDMTLYAKWTPVQTVTPTVTPTATASVTPTVTAEPTGLPTTTPTVQPTGEDDGGKPAGSVLPLIGGILILILAVLLLLFLLLRHTVTFLIPAGGEITEYRIKVWHGRYIDPADLPELLRTAAWYRDPARRERWDFNEDRVTKSIELYLG
ncbi:MAG TPA: InlB B-repeat-containing protein [Methanocorpusculum sp.]|nr:InlB B-repeat-containing protein [Methanocorpusculum sp.]